MFECAECLAFSFRTIMVILAVIEYLAEVIKPIYIHHGTMGQYQCAGKFFFFYHLQRGESLAKTHFGIPQHLIASSETLASAVDGIPLFRAEDDRGMSMRDSGRMQAGLTLFYGCDGFLYCFQVTAEPFVSTTDTIKLLTLDSRTFQHLVYLFVVESHYHATTNENADFRVEQLICNARSLGVLAYTLMSGLLQYFCIGEQIAAVVFVECCLADFQTITMPFVIDGEYVNQFGFQ